LAGRTAQTIIGVLLAAIAGGAVGLFLLLGYIVLFPRVESRNFNQVNAVINRAAHNAQIEPTSTSTVANQRATPEPQFTPTVSPTPSPVFSPTGQPTRTVTSVKNQTVKAPTPYQPTPTRQPTKQPIKQPTVFPTVHP
jgi:hypothetical protein